METSQLIQLLVTGLDLSYKVELLECPNHNRPASSGHHASNQHVCFVHARGWWVVLELLAYLALGFAV